MRFGSIQGLAIGHDGGPNEARNQQYALAGAYVVQRCDYLIAVYDGEPAAGTGGTAQVLRWYREGGIDEQYQFPHYYFMPPQRNPALIFHPEPE